MPRVVAAFRHCILFLVVAAPCWTWATSRAFGQEQEQAPTLTLERIMSDPDWIGNSPEDAYWADDGQTIFYRVKRVGSQRSDWREVDLLGNILRIVDLEDLSRIDAAGGQLNRRRSRKVYARNGDIFVKNLDNGELRQLTRTVESESDPQFLADGRRVFFRRGDAILVRDLRTGLESQLLDPRAEKDPEEGRRKSREELLAQQQQRLFDYLRKSQLEADQRRELADQMRDKDAMRAPAPWYLGVGDQHRIGRVSPSSDARRVLISLTGKNASEGQADRMPQFVHATGYVDVRTVRPLVGTGKAVSDKLLLLDVATREELTLGFDDLPGWSDDPLADVRRENEEFRKTLRENEVEQQNSDDQAAGDRTAGGEQRAGGEQSEAASDPLASDPLASDSQGRREAADQEKSPQDQKLPRRAVQVGSMRWSDDGRMAALQLFSTDNKDRWVVVLDDKTRTLRTVLHERDSAWVNWRVGRLDWLPDNQTIYYVSEESGYAHLYLHHVPSQATRQLTSGEFEVSDVEPSRDGRYVYFTANRDHSGVYECFRVDVGEGGVEQLTRMGGRNRGQASPDQKHLLVTHSTALHPPELWVQPLDGGEARQITQTASDEFRSLPWVAPRFVTVPSRAGRPIHARLYLPPATSSPPKPRPAVLFIHGAGYLQNAHQGWSSYFREFMFHSFLAHRGYVVLDLDYRASAGYGRDWRTAIYRHMGGPEVEDLEDGRQWLIEQHAVDGQRIGLYGGSYGGFLTMMALFQRPGTFACGAALRPVTDWKHYSHGYTANILNTPDMDLIAYRRSSPIEFAAGLSEPLLICHGMVDDNVFFKDTVRLTQRLIELQKEDWEVAIYPIEPHGFNEPSSWLDEYRRINKLFERHLMEH